MVDTIRKHPMKNMMWYPTFTLTSSEVLYRIYFFLYHCVPSMFFDLGLKFVGSKKRLHPIYSKIFVSNQLMFFFTERTWTFHDDAKREILNLMTDEDHESFPCNPTSQEIMEAQPKFAVGFSKYFLKQNEEDFSVARQKLKKFFVLHYTFLAALYSLVAFALFKNFA